VRSRGLNLLLIVGGLSLMAALAVASGAIGDQLDVNLIARRVNYQLVDEFWRPWPYLLMAMLLLLQWRFPARQSEGRGELWVDVVWFVTINPMLVVAIAVYATLLQTTAYHLTGGHHLTLSDHVPFAVVVAACFVLGAWFARAGRGSWAWFSRITGVVFAGSFLTLSSGSGGATAILVFTAAVVLVWAWLTAVSVKLYRGVASV